MKRKYPEMFFADDMVPFGFWVFDEGIENGIYRYVKPFSVNKEFSHPQPISKYYLKNLSDIVPSDMEVVLEIFETKFFVYNAHYYKRVRVIAPVYELNGIGFFVLKEESYESVVPDDVSIREAKKIYPLIAKKIEEFKLKKNQELIDKTFKELSEDGKTAIFFGLSAEELLKIDTKKYEVNFMDKDEMGDFTVQLVLKE